MARRSKSSDRWLREHFDDPYVQRARREGWRSRAAFKLEEIDRAERLIRPGMRIVDLGAAPGGWSQYAARILGGRGQVVALDVLPLEAMPGVQIVQGDFRDPQTLERLLAVLGGGPVDLVLSDMAPNMSGVDVVDQARGMELAELAVETALRVLGPEGVLLAKVFQGAGFEALLKHCRGRFARVRLRKPRASRARSPETYMLARNPRTV